MDVAKVYGVKAPRIFGRRCCPQLLEHRSFWPEMKEQAILLDHVHRVTRKHAEGFVEGICSRNANVSSNTLLSHSLLQYWKQRL